eukprot:GFKZ01001314.1.p1 GENE.GFKZ01001314.1~~GFKZ01001314.1.p1  ORF type:complete len:591 (-),score=66.26 GFKZ01001314.1:234-2006(-)
MFRYRLFIPSLFATIVLCALQVNADIRWDTCEGTADHPSIGEGNYYNLCIIEEEFVGESHAWTFVKSGIYNSVFNNCSFTNTIERTNTFTESNWNDVTFKDCTFGSYTENPLIFDKIVMTNVLFDGCVFKNSVNLNFTEFLLNNVTFSNVLFEGDTNFELGQMNDITFHNSQFKHSNAAETASGNDALRFRQVTAREVIFTDNNIVNPVRVEGVAAADWSFNDTSVNEFWCHSEPNKQGDVKFFSSFNDTAFHQVTFRDNFRCDLTTWKGLLMANVTFERNADFKNSDILDIYWDEVEMNSPSSEAVTLDFTKTRIKRDILWNTTIGGAALFTEAVIETVFISNFVATKPNFVDTVFTNQEFIDGICCSSTCVTLGCKCNVSEPSGQCPSARAGVNTSVFATCFPADATVSRHDGLIVRMEDLALAEKIAVGGGEHSDVFFFGHRNSEELSDYVSIKHTGSDTRLRISPGHYLYVDGKLRTARSVRAGNRLRDVDGKDTLFVTEVAGERLRGAYAPTSMHGDLVVDGVVVSSYTDVMHPGLAHKLLHPLRLLYRYGFDSIVSRMTMLHERSFAHVPRKLGISKGPEVIED